MDPDGAPHLVFDWRPGATSAELDQLLDVATPSASGPVESAICPHPGGPPTCWCRPPLPGLPLAFARRYGVDPARSVVVGASTAERAEDALTRVMAFTDDAIMLGIPEIKIIHGRGMGILKQMIRDYLRSQREVASVADEQIERGGDGATVVVLK